MNREQILDLAQAHLTLDNGTRWIATDDEMVEFGKALLGASALHAEPAGQRDAIRAAALEEAADVCGAIMSDHWAQYKGHGKWAGQDNPRRADPHADGASDGASECEDAIRALASQPVAPVQLLPSDVCPRCEGYGDIHTGIDEAPTTQCLACDGTGEKAHAAQMDQQEARWAIDGAIAFGRMGVNQPPSADHWLSEYWQIGQQLAKLGETCAWDNVTPTESQSAILAASSGAVAVPEGWQPIETAPEDGTIDILMPNGTRWAGAYYDRICNEWRRITETGHVLRVKRDYPTHWHAIPPAPAIPAQGQTK